MAQDIYQTVTDNILEALEKGTVPWRRPWNPEACAGPASAKNAATGHIYSGVNQIILGMHPAAFVTGDPRFCTFKQAQEKGWSVRKGAKGTGIVFYRPLEVENDKHDPAKENSPATKIIGLLRGFHVFHASDIDGVPPYTPPTVEDCPWMRPDAVQTILNNSGARVTIGGDRAFYSPMTDHINLPPDSAFRGPEYWAATAAHEMAHWTGAKERLNRDLSGAKGSQLYSLEELRAECASAFIGATLNIPCEIENHASYLEHWIKALKADKKAIFHAAADAQRIADYLLDFHPYYKLAHTADLKRAIGRAQAVRELEPA